MTIEEILKAAVDKKNKEQLNRDRAELLNTLGKDITNALTPVLQEIAKKSSVSADGVVEAIASGVEKGFKNLKLPEPNITVQSPDVYVPEVKFPNIPTPVVNFDLSKIKIPDVVLPDEMNITGWVNLQNGSKPVSYDNPLPVELRDSKGNPLKLFENLTQVMGGGGGFQYPTIAGFNQSAYAELTNPDGRLRVSVETGGSGLTDAELRASRVFVEQVSGANWSVSVVGGAGLTDTELRASAVPVAQVSGATWSVIASLETTASLYNADNRIRVSMETGVAGLTDTELRASSVPVSQVSGAINSVNVQQIAGQTPSLNAGDADAGTLRTVIAKSANATTTAISVGADASTNVALTNLFRKSIMLTHQSTSTLYIATGTAASTTSIPIVANQFFGFDDYVGPVNAIAEEQAGTISVRYIEII